MNDQIAASLEQLCEVGASFYGRGYAFGSTGNLSVRVGDQIWITPTGASLQNLNPNRLACVNLSGVTQNENRPSKEYPFHLAFYQKRADVRAVVHLHSTYAVALSCTELIKDGQPLPALTPYFYMRVAPVAVLPYFRPGSSELAAAVEEAAPGHNSLLLRNHGLICVGPDLTTAVDRTEEFEQTARLFFILRNETVRLLTPEQIEELRITFGDR